MDTYLLTWNPKQFKWNPNADVADIKKHGFIDGSWSSGNTKRIKPGDRVYLLRQGLEPRGIMASGCALSNVYEDEHWKEEAKGKTTLYVDVRFESMVDPDAEGVLPLSRLSTGGLGYMNWRTQSSGITIPSEAAAELDLLWTAFLEERGQSPSMQPDELATPALFFEGASRTVSVNVYERDPRARKACINHHGTSCTVCGFDFGATYGELGKGFIHVHHLVPLADVGKEYVIDPIRDLRPVCPNCHAMLHRQRKVASIEELQTVMNAGSTKPEVNVELLRDALDHIIRTALHASVQTNRLNWIAARAKLALRGGDWSKESLPEPKKQKGERVRELEIALRKVIKAVESEDDVALSETLAEIHVMFPSL